MTTYDYGFNDFSRNHLYNKWPKEEFERIETEIYPKVAKILTTGMQEGFKHRLVAQTHLEHFFKLLYEEMRTQEEMAKGTDERLEDEDENDYYNRIKKKFFDERFRF